MASTGITDIVSPQALPRLCPWSSWDQDWFIVYSLLHRATAVLLPRGRSEASAADLEAALACGRDACLRMLSWLRSRHRCPAVVECTYACLHALCQSRGRLSQLESDALRFQVGAALARFVNAVADAAQRGVHAVSVARLATVAGLPRVAIDVRHEACHGALPSRAATLHVAAAVLHWALEAYWRPQADRVGLRLEPFVDDEAAAEHARVRVQVETEGLKSVTAGNLNRMLRSLDLTRACVQRSVTGRIPEPLLLAHCLNLNPALALTVARRMERRNVAHVCVSSLKSALSRPAACGGPEPRHAVALHEALLCAGREAQTEPALTSRRRGWWRE